MANYEIRFSALNLHVSSHCSAVQTDRLLDLLVIKLLTFPLPKFNPDEYVKTWIMAGIKLAKQTAFRKDEEPKVNQTGYVRIT
jgi:hypothetical protein